MLAQIIFEQENKEGQSLLPIAFLRQLIRFYGDSMQMMVPKFLEQSMSSLTSQQGKFREQITQAFGGVGGFGPMEEHVRRNMEMFEKTFAMFAPPFARGGKPGEAAASRQAAIGRRDGRAEAPARRDAEAAGQAGRQGIARRHLPSCRQPRSA